jgi:FHS family L-fucose permease-like MFS transporter
MHISANYRSAFSIITALFFMWGFITCLNDILIPHLKEAFDLKYWQAMLVQFAFFGAYFVVSLFYYLYSAASGDPIARIGYQRGLVVGLLLSGLGCALFFPAAAVHSYAFFLAALFVLASGITIIQIAANPFVAILGPEETASGRLNLAQGLNSLGYVIAPVIGGVLIFGSNLKGAESVKMPYLALAGAFLVLAGIFEFIKLPRLNTGQEFVQVNVLQKYPHFKFSMMAIFCYVGAEVAVGSVLVNYLGLPDVMGYDPETATRFLSFYWGGLMIGRFMGAISLGSIQNQTKKAVWMLTAAAGSTAVIFLASSRNWFSGVQLLQFRDITLFLIMVALSYGAFFLGKSKPGRMVGIFSIFIIALIMLTMGSTGAFSMWTIIGIGLFNSVMWSNIFTLSIEKLGKDTSQGSALLVMMIVGGALFPPIQGLVADWSLIGLKYSLVVPMLAYVYLAWYGLKGYRH